MEASGAAMTAHLGVGVKIASSAWHKLAKAKLALRDHFFIFKFSTAFVL